MKRNAFAPLALASLLAMHGCDLSESSNKEAQTRSFAPRILDIPQSDFVRLEVSSTDLSNFQGNTKPQSGFYQTFQVSYSTRRISADKIPTGPLFFRLSGLDASQTPIWVVSKAIPDGQTPVVNIGSGTDNAPRSIAGPTITTPSGASYPMISCTSGSPAWTIDGSNPSADNGSSTRFSNDLSMQSTVQLTQGQTLTARCTDKIVWSTSKTYKFTGPTSNPNPTSPAGNFGNKVPTLIIPSAPSGQIQLSVNASDTTGFASCSFWKIAYRLDQSSWNTTQPGSTIPYSGSGTVSAFLMAWDGNNWLAGQATNSVYPKVPTTPPGGALPVPSVYVYTPTNGTGNSDISINAFASGYSYTGWKALYRFSTGDSNWIPIELPTNQMSVTSLNASIPGVAGSGTISVYLVAYNPTSQSWLSSTIATAVFPAASAIGAGKTFPAPQIIPPSGGMGSVTYSFDTTAYPSYSRWNVVTKINADAPFVQNLSNASTYISGTGTMSAYLVAWNGSAWTAGEAVSRSYPPQPDSAAPNGPGTELSKVAIQAPDQVPGMVRFSDPGMVTCPSCTNWKIAYKLSKAAAWKLTDLTMGVSVGDTGNIEAYLMAWSTNNYKWIYGPTASANYPDVPTPAVILPAGTNPISLNFQLPTSLPDKITFSKGAQISYSNWMVIYMTSEMTEWKMMPIDSGCMMQSNGTIEFYPMAWDANTRTWITGSKRSTNVTGGQSILNPQVVPPGGPLPAPTIVVKPPLAAEVGFSLNLTAADSAAYTAGTWKIVYQFDANDKWLLDATATVSVNNTPGATSLNVYTEAWNPTLKRWVSGRTASISLPVVVKIDAPVFKNNSGDVLGSKWEREGFTALPLRIEGTGSIYYTTAAYGDPDPANLTSGTSLWTTGTRIPYTGEEPLTIKAISVVDGFKSSTTSIEISRPAWVARDNEVAGCLGTNGTMVVACGDETGPMVWSHDQGWSPLDPGWSHSTVKLVKVTESDVLVLTNSQEILRMDFGAGSSSFESIAPSNVMTFGGLEVFNDTIWTTTTVGPLYYDETRMDWYPPNSASAAMITYMGTPGAMWSDSNTSLWFAVGYNLYRYGASQGASVYDGVTQWYTQLNNGGCLWIGRDPLVANGVAFGSGSAVYQVAATPSGYSSSYINAYGGIVVQVASTGTAAFVATDNGVGGGGVARSNSWNNQTNITTLRKWPMSGNTPVSSQGVVRYTADGSDWLLATTYQGTYQFRVLP